MNREEARALADAELAKLRLLPYDELVARFLKREQSREVVGASGTQYQLELVAFWDDKKTRDLRVRAAIDDGSWRAFVPLTADFIIAPDGTFVGE